MYNGGCRLFAGVTILFLLICGFQRYLAADDGNTTLQEAVKSASKAARENKAEFFKKAAGKLGQIIKKLERTAAGSERVKQEVIQSLKVIQFWNREFMNDLKQEEGQLEKKKKPEIVNTVKPEVPDKEKPVEPVIKPVEKTKGTEKELRAFLIKVISIYSEGKPEEANRKMGTFFAKNKEKYSPAITRLILSYIKSINGVLDSFYREVGKMKGDTVYYKVSNSTKYLKGKLENVIEGKAVISTSSIKMGLPVLNLANNSLVQAGNNLTNKERLVLSLYMLFNSKVTLGTQICPPVKKGGELEAFIDLLKNIIVAKEENELLEKYEKQLTSANKSLAATDYSRALGYVLRISSLTDIQLLKLNARYTKKSERNILQLLVLCMTKCDECDGEFKLKCPNCKGSGKVIGETEHTFLESGGISMKLVTCKKCGGKGVVYCTQCYRRRVSKEALGLLKRFAVLLKSSEQ